MTRLPSGALAVIILTASSFAQQLAPVRVLSITAGPAGSENNGGFVLHEERSVFGRVTDREIIVVFQWEDVPGAHKLVAQWRSPDGAASVTSAIDYKAAEKRFGALGDSDSAKAGLLSSRRADRHDDLLARIPAGGSLAEPQRRPAISRPC
jgi:hypothetical protein